jgi:DNA phosphorothioation-associated putative methyltransferase
VERPVGPIEVEAVDRRAIQEPSGHGIAGHAGNVEVHGRPGSRTDAPAFRHLVCRVLVKLGRNAGGMAVRPGPAPDGAYQVGPCEAVGQPNRPEVLGDRVEDRAGQEFQRKPGLIQLGNVEKWSGFEAGAITLGMSLEGSSALDEVTEPEVTPARRIEVEGHAALVTGWNGIVNAHEGGKRLSDALYLHRGAIGASVAPSVERLAAEAGCSAFEIAKFTIGEPRLSLLHYPGFNDEPFPALSRATTVDLRTGAVRVRTYAPGTAPILHRKELLLPPGDPRFRDWASLTLQAEDAGLFDHPAEIGTRTGWERTLSSAGLRVEGHTLVEDGPEVQRHRTALVRYALSTPMDALYQHGFLDGRHRIFDYGCGRGGDLAQLERLAVPAAGWDPHFAPGATKELADIVNLGFVLNVIESQSERAEALKGAWGLATKLMVVAVLIGGRSAWEKHRLFRDGVVTSKGTFQKYFAQDELRTYIEQHTGRQPIALAPGLFFVFREDEDEQAFLADRQRSRRSERPMRARLPKLDRPERPVRSPRAKAPKPDRWEPFREVLDAFWARCLHLGRAPEPGEFEDEGALAEAGSPSSIMRHCVQRFGEAPLAEARDRRAADLLVWLALGCFERRRSYQKLPPSLRTDVRAFWGSWTKAQDLGRQLLFSAGDTGTVFRAAETAATGGVGVLEGTHALFVRGHRVRDLPGVLRVYVGCAGQLAGEPESADVLKVHLQGGKLTLLNYDDFDRPLPDLVERVKVDLRRASIQFFSYEGGPYPPQPLLWKSRLLAPDDPDQARCARLEARLEKLGFDLRQIIDRPTFEQRLGALGYSQRGWVLRKIITSQPGETSE